MAQAVEAAIEARTTLICEAGTGTGKTFAYLVPALLSGRKVIVSTGTRNLQDQLFHKDVPLIREVLAHKRRVALLKGRSNYLCLHRLKLARAGPLAAPLASAVEEITRWAQQTDAGDVSEVGALAEDHPVWPRVTSTVDNCLGQECPDFGSCHVMRARREAMAADFVVINHHLLLANMALKAEGAGELLPSADAFVVDEAHQLGDIAAQFFGESVTGRQLLDLARDSVSEAIGAGGSRGDALTATRDLENATRVLRLAFGTESRRGPWSNLRGDEALETALARVRHSLESVRNWLESRSAPTRGIESCLERCRRLLGRLVHFAGEANPDGVQWYETRGRGFALNWTPLSVAEPISVGMRSCPSAWVFTSATLSVDGGFSHFVKQLGLDSPTTLSLPSPFDYRRNALLYLPPNMPDPSHSDYTRAVVTAATPVVQASRGRCFMLFTSHRALRDAATILERQVPYPLLLQGSAPRDELLRRFRSSGNAVLLGTSSFWEGVDVRGQALSCVIIDRLPFASPGDPVLAARIERAKEQGGNPFREMQIPAAVLSLKQGVGRLIRDVTDRGVMMICDPRLLTRSYGRAFLASLPDMPRSQSLDAVRSFLTESDSVNEDPGD